jgi:hypothetical protein
VDTLERAIRSALEKGDAGDRAYREKVYQSAFAALERALNNPNVSEENALARRSGLQQTIARIEGEHLAASRPVQSRPDGDPRSNDRSIDPAPPVVSAETRQAPSRAVPASERREPVLTAERREPVLDEYRIDADLDETVRGETRQVRRRRRPLAWLFIVITALAVLALAAWWVVGSGLFLSASQRDGAVPNPSPVREAEGFDPTVSNSGGSTAAPRLGGQAQDPNAIALFTPGDQDDFTVPGDAVAELTGEGEGRALRIHSGRSGSAIAFNVPQDVLGRLAGQRALFLVEAQAEDGQSTQISISCSFGELGDCGGRRRFDLTGERGDVIFDVELPNVQPGSDGTIAIVSDVSNNSKAVDIFSIRVSGGN